MPGPLVSPPDEGLLLAGSSSCEPCDPENPDPDRPECSPKICPDATEEFNAITVTLSDFDICGSDGSLPGFENLNGTYTARRGLIQNDLGLDPEVGWGIIKVDAIDAGGNPTPVYIDIAWTCGTPGDPPSVPFIQLFFGSFGNPSLTRLADFAAEGLEFSGGTVNVAQICGYFFPTVGFSFQLASGDEGTLYAFPEECLECCGDPANQVEDKKVSRKLESSEVISNIVLERADEGTGNYQIFRVENPDLRISYYRDAQGRFSQCAVETSLIDPDPDVLDEDLANVVIELNANGKWCAGENPAKGSEVSFGSLASSDPTPSGSQTLLGNWDGFDWRLTFDVAPPSDADDCQPPLCCGGRWQPPSGSVCPITDWIMYRLDDRNQFPGAPRNRRIWLQPDGNEAPWSIGPCSWLLPAVDENGEPSDPVQVDMLIGPTGGGSFVFGSRYPLAGDPGFALVGDGNGQYCGRSAQSQDGWNTYFNIEATVSGVERCDPKPVRCVDWGANRGYKWVKLTSASIATGYVDLDLATNFYGYTGRVNFSLSYVGERFLEGSAGELTPEESACPVWIDPPVDFNQVVPPPIPGPERPHTAKLDFRFYEDPLFVPTWYLALSFNSTQQAYCDDLVSFATEEVSGDGNQPPSSRTWTIRDPSQYTNIIGEITVSGTDDVDECTEPTAATRPLPEKFGNRFFALNPRMKRSAGCSACDDVRQLMNGHGPAGLAEHGRRWAAEINRLTGHTIEDVLRAMERTADTMRKASER